MCNYRIFAVHNHKTELNHQKSLKCLLTIKLTAILMMEIT